MNRASASRPHTSSRAGTPKERIIGMISEILGANAAAAFAANYAIIDRVCYRRFFDVDEAWARIVSICRADPSILSAIIDAPNVTMFEGYISRLIYRPMNEILPDLFREYETTVSNIPIESIKDSLLYKCKCGSRKIHDVHVQKASSDEPAKILCTCLSCGREFEARF